MDSVSSSGTYYSSVPSLDDGTSVSSSWIDDMASLASPQTSPELTFNPLPLTPYESSQAYFSPTDEHYKPDLLLTSTGAQYHQNDYQVPSTFHVISPLQVFNSMIGDIQQTAWEATRVAQTRLRSGQATGEPVSFTMITSGSVQRASQHLSTMIGAHEDPYRAAVQDVLCRQLYAYFKDGEQSQTVLDTALQEAACQLLLHVQEANSSTICYYAVAMVLTRLQAQLELEDRPEATSLDGYEASPAQKPSPSPPTKEKFFCNVEGCKQKGFGRPADLDRHVKMVHCTDSQKRKFLCDYRRCTRHDSPFYRQDHFRDHLRDFHKEDLPRRGNKGDAAWWGSRAPPSGRWWRCNRCLVVRVDFDKHGFVCFQCGTHCEMERQKFRQKMASFPSSSKGSSQHKSGASAGAGGRGK